MEHLPTAEAPDRELAPVTADPAHAHARATPAWATRPSPRVLLAAALFIALCDVLRTVAGGGVLADALTDEPAHLATGLLVVAAFGIPAGRPMVAALASSVLIDLDHVPQHLGTQFLTEGTARPYPHSLLTLLVVAAVALAAPRVRTVALAVLAALAFHFIRDLSEPGSGVALLWPFSDHTFRLAYALYAVIVAVLLAGGVARSNGSARRRASSAAG